MHGLPSAAARRWRWHSPPHETVAARPPRRLAARVPPSRGASRRAARRRGPRRGQTRPRSSWAAARVGRALGDLGDRGARVSVAAGEGGEVGRLQRLGALWLLARAARHRPGADHGLAGDPRPRRRAGGRSVRQAPPQERAAVAGLAGARRPRVAHPAAGRGGVLVAHDHRAAPGPAATSRAAPRGRRQARRLDGPRAPQRRPRTPPEPHSHPAPRAAQQGAETLQGHHPPPRARAPRRAPAGACAGGREPCVSG